MKLSQFKKLIGIVVCLIVVYFVNHVNSSTDFIEAEKSISTSTSTASSEDLISTESEYEFRTEKLYNSHYEKHGEEFGDITQKEYLALANQLINSNSALRKTEKEDGDDVIYDEDKNYFLILSKDGYIRTFFRPDAGLEYYERQ